MAEKLEIIITADTQNAIKNISGVNSALGGLGSLAAGALKVGLAAGTAAVGALATGLAYAITEAVEAEKVMAQTNAVIKSTSGIAGMTTESVTDLAKSLSEVTRFSDETIQAGENILLTFTSIGKDVFPQATQTILDMSQALGQDLQSSAIQLGKALQDPILGVSALRRVGVNFSEAQQEMIKSMVESGKAAEAQRLILQELQTEFGGSAEAAGQTFGGQLDILKNKFSNLAEEIGNVFLPPLTSGLGILSGMFDQIKTAVEPVITAFGTFFYAIQQGFTPLEALQIAFGNLIPANFKELWDAVMATFTNLSVILQDPNTQTAIKNIGEAMGQLAQVSLDALIASATAFFQQFTTEDGAGVVLAVNTIAHAINGLSVTIQTLTPLILPVFDSLKLGFDALMLPVNMLVGLLTDGLPGALKPIKNLGDDAIKTLLDIAAAFGDAPRQAIEGWIAGFNKWAQPGIDAVTQFANDVAKAFKDALGIHSPSAVFAEFGKFTMQGLTLGINANATQPQMAMVGAASGMVSTAYSSTQLNNYGPIYPTVQESASLASLLESARQAAQPN